MHYSYEKVSVLIRITVLKTLVFEDLIKEYCAIEQLPKCPIFYENQVFELSDISYPPHGFCSWAWADIQRDVAMLDFNGIPQPRMKKSDSIISCCCEGIRPVVFLIEKL